MYAVVKTGGKQTRVAEGERVFCDTDARITHVVITDEGTSFIGDADATLHAAVREHFVDRLSRADVDRLVAIWRKINDGEATC